MHYVGTLRQERISLLQSIMYPQLLRSDVRIIGARIFAMQKKKKKDPRRPQFSYFLSLANALLLLLTNEPQLSLAASAIAY